MLTSLFEGRPEPAILNVLPGSPTSGVVFSSFRSGDVVAVAAIGPGSAATPGIAGAVSGPGVAKAGAARSKAPASTAPMVVSVVLVLMGALAFGSGGDDSPRG